ncbi:hypothetical protein HPB49_013035 [Dermacentor silvarum]|uniref:Uncharacterized protein n=1 Tax=Dermacentor silvarum TaxID=543639 RepID=A0ACB8D5N1_DERSI|nr:hypothetical protein HPB49_013035 [Dermacentor silvarum]
MDLVAPRSYRDATQDNQILRRNPQPLLATRVLWSREERRVGDAVAASGAGVKILALVGVHAANRPHVTQSPRLTPYASRRDAAADAFQHVRLVGALLRAAASAHLGRKAPGGVCHVLLFAGLVWSNVYCIVKSHKPSAKGDSSDNVFKGELAPMNISEWKVKHACRNGSLRILFFVHTAPKNIEKRRWLRKTVGDPNIVSIMNSVIIFFVGETSQWDEHEAVSDEAIREGDVVVLNFKGQLQEPNRTSSSLGQSGSPTTAVSTLQSRLSNWTTTF